MLRTSSRLHSFTYAVLLSIVLICSSIHMASLVSAHLVPNDPANLVYMSAIVSGILAPPASIMLAVYSNKLISIQEQLHELATTDPLTGLLNRRAFETFYNRESARCNRLGQPVSLVLLDLDLFKDINNRHGHAGGDIALRNLAECLRTAIRYGADELVRWGGEEFAILMTDTNRSKAIRAALRVRQHVLALKVPYAGNVITMTASFGVTQCLPGEPLVHAMTRVDKCLRQAKAQGRNKVVAFPEFSPEAEEASRSRRDVVPAVADSAISMSATA